jgi:hypothetical protein
MSPHCTAFERVAPAEGSSAATRAPPAVTREDVAFGFARPARAVRGGGGGVAPKEKPLPGQIDADMPLAFGSELGSAGEALGSTQSSGCAGDFCDVDFFASSDTGMRCIWHLLPPPMFVAAAAAAAGDRPAAVATDAMDSAKGILSAAEYAAIAASKSSGSSAAPAVFTLPFRTIAQVSALGVCRHAGWSVLEPCGCVLAGSC